MYIYIYIYMYMYAIRNPKNVIGKYLGPYIRVRARKLEHYATLIMPLKARHTES